MKHLFRRVVVVGIVFFSVGVHAQVSFDNVTSDLGPFHTGETWGASWVDINNDYYPDIGNNNHRHRQSMWINQAGQGFRDGILQFDREWALIAEVDQDSHGSSYADLDNDGDQDLIQMRSSGGGRAQVFLNEQGYGIEQAESMGIYSLTGAGRIGAAYDYNRDGLLDLFFASSSRTRNRIFENLGGNSFDDVTPSSFNASGVCDGLNYYQFTDIVDDTTGLSNLEILCIDEGNFPIPVLDASAGTTDFLDVTEVGIHVSNTVDTATGDFDGDGDNDLIALRGSIRYNGASLVSPTKIEAWITTQTSTGSKSFTFESAGSIAFDDLHISRDPTEFDQIRIGSSDNTITSFPVVLDKNDASAQGISTSTGKGVYIGYDTATAKWTLRITSTDFEDYYVEISGEGLTEPDDFVLHPVKDAGNKPTLFKNTDTGFERVYNIGIDEVTCASIATGDFDNDMDLDIYLACGWGVANISNRLYLNDGSGKFEEVLSHGAEGVIGAGIEQSYGVAESVVMADYDLDGRLDLFTTNGALFQPEFLGGPDELFRNTTNNSNSWIELDLIGVNVNRDAMGAKITATAGGVDQVREQNGAYHRWSQHHKRTHFGLGSNSTVDITVEWPDGSVDTYPNLTANSLYEVMQGGAVQAIVPSGYNDYPEAAAGDECSDRGQAYTPELDKGIFLSKDCVTGLWSLRAVAGGSEGSISFNGYILSSESIVGLTEFEFEAGDSATVSGRRLDFSLSMSGAGVDGIGFDLGNATDACILIENEDNITVGEFHLLAPAKLNLIQMGACDLNPNGSLNVPQSTTVSLDSDSLVIPGSGGSATHLIDLSSLGVSIGDTVTVSQLLANGDLNNNVGVEYFSLNFNSGEYNFTQIETGFDCSGLVPTLTELNQSVSVIDIGGGVPGIQISGDTTSGVGSSCNDVEYQLTVSASTPVIDDSSTEVCGMPSYTSDTDSGFYVWKDCGGTEIWNVRATAGGGGAINYSGNFLADTAISTVVPFSLESSDSYGLSLSDKSLSFNMRMGGIWQDGIGFNLGSGSELCLTLDDPSQTIYVGSESVSFNSSVNLKDLTSACVTPPQTLTLSSADVSAAEALGQAIVTINLSAASTDVVNVEYATSDGTAIAGQDYTSGSGTVTFAPGEITKSITIPLLQDVDLEESENFNLLLSNSTVDIANNTVVITIEDAGCLSPANGDMWFYEYYEGVWTTVPNFDNEVIVASGTADAISVAPALANDYYGLRFTGCIDVPVSGNYIFNTSSDDGSLLYVDNELVVDNDGLHGVRTVTADYYLEAGVHQIKVDFFERTGGNVLSADWTAPTVACGKPIFDQSTDAGLFLWKACDANNAWNLSASAGGGSTVTYSGSIVANSVISILDLISFEPSDIADLSNSDQQLDFQMTVGSVYRDAMEFSLGSDDACFGVDLPVGLDVVVGQADTVVTPPFNLLTLDPC